MAQTETVYAAYMFFVINNCQLLEFPTIKRTCKWCILLHRSLIWRVHCLMI